MDEVRDNGMNNWESKLIENVCSKIQVLLDRYNALRKSTKQQTVLTERE